MNETTEPAPHAENEWRQAPYQSALQAETTATPNAYQSALLPEALPMPLPMALPMAEAALPAAPPQRKAMSTQTRLSLGMLAVAGGAGVAGDALLRAVPWGPNLLLWLSLTVGAVVLWQRQAGIVRNRETNWLTGSLFVFAFGFLWRDSAVLRALDVLALAVLLTLIGLRAQTGKLLRAAISEYLGAALHCAGNAMTGPLILLFNEIGWRELPRAGWSRRAFAIGRGVLIALPLLFVFGVLLVAADAAFEELVAKLFRLDFASLFLHVMAMTGIAWLVSGYLRALQPEAKPGNLAGAATKIAPKLGIVEIGTALSLLDALFLVFVLVQFQYLFFGAAHFKPGAGTAYAIYARRGFFELVTVAALVLPLLLGAHWLLRKDEPQAERIFRVLAGTQIGLLFVMMASALYRMRLYQLCCGLTELRVYTMAFMIWLALVFGWFAWTVLRGQRERFTFGAVAARLALVAILHVINPDELIARVNVQRAQSGLPLDVLYTASLSADSIPALVAGLPYLKPEDQRLLRQRLLERQPEFAYRGWRSWNWARMRAWQSCEALRSAAR
ncbi:MAG: DUF4173 domain-containing protein [Acidobacteria bacterium]|nr:DUF4173 domain-containing protein [Acidobacteriota bacterium]MBI3427050.1 DUF4173 domain-containing protein [Acidobacteriota bacterium]